MSLEWCEGASPVTGSSPHQQATHTSAAEQRQQQPKAAPSLDPPRLVSTPQQYPHPQQQQSQPLEPYQQQQQQQQRQRQVFLDLLGRITELEKRVEESDNRLTSAIKREMRSSQIPSKGTFQSRGDLWDTIPRHREVEEIEEDMAERQPTAFWTETTTAAATGYPRSSRMRAFGVQVCRIFLHKSLLHQRIKIVGRFF